MTKKTGKIRPKKIAVLVGSLSQESTSKNLAKYFIAVAPKSLDLKVVEIGKLSLYNEDLDDKPPKEWTLFRDQMKNYDGFLFITPEMNGSFSGSLKNAIDIASSPYSQNVFNEKPGAVVSVSAGAAERNGANPHLRQSLIFLKVQTMQQPEACIGDAKELFDQKGNLTNKETLQFIKTFISSFDEWVHR